MGTSAVVTLPLHYRYITVALQLHYRYISATLQLHYRHITCLGQVPSPLHYRHVTTTLPLHIRATLPLHYRYSTYSCFFNPPSTPSTVPAVPIVVVEQGASFGPPAQHNRPDIFQPALEIKAQHSCLTRIPNTALLLCR